jgi:predicted transcriptional regulator
METYQFTNKKSLDQFYEMISAKKRNGFVVVEHNEKLPYVVLSKEKKAIKHSLIVTLSRKKNILVAVDEDGNLFEDKCLSA